MDELGYLLDSMRGCRAGHEAIGLPDGAIVRWGPLFALVESCCATLDAHPAAGRARVLVASSDPSRTLAAVLACLWSGRTAAIIDANAPPAVALESADVITPGIAWLSDAHLPVHAWPSGVTKLVIPQVAASHLLRYVTGVRLRPPAACEPSADAIIMLTSGSSGRPKGVRLSRRAVACHLRTLWKAWSDRTPVRMASLLPLHHVDGLFQGALLPLVSDGMTWLSSGDPRVSLSLPELTEAVQRYALTHVLLTPAHARFFALRAQDDPLGFRAPTFRFAISTAAHLHDDVWQLFQSAFGVPLANVYGLSETVAGSCFAIPGTDSHRVGTVGKPLDCEVRAVAENGREIAAGEVGELRIRGDHLFAGYMGDVEGGLAMDGDWLCTGDLGTIDAEGFVRVHGRLAASFKSGGLLVNPEATTAVLRREPEVLDAASTAIPDPLMGFVLGSAVVLKPGATLSPGALLSRIADKLPAAERPRHLQIVDHLPVGPSGKPQQQGLARIFADVATRAARAGEHAWATVREAAAEAFGTTADQLAPHDTPETVREWDSFGHLAFVSALEARLDRTLSLDEIQGLRSLGDAIRLLESHES